MAKDSTARSVVVFAIGLTIGGVIKWLNGGFDVVTFVIVVVAVFAGAFGLFSGGRQLGSQRR